MYQEIQAILAKYPEIKRIRIEKEETFEREKPVVARLPSIQSVPVPQPVQNPDLFQMETIKEFPKVKKTPDETEFERLRQKQIKDSMAGLQLPKN